MSKNILYITMMPINSLEDRNIYTDLVRCFLAAGHHVTIICPIERREGKYTWVEHHGNLTILHVWILNYQKTSWIEKGISLLTLRYFMQYAVRKKLNLVNVDLLYYSTPPITIASLIYFLKRKYNCKTYLLLKDIFPQNAVDLAYFGGKSWLFRYFRRIEKQLYRVSDHIGCMSPRNIAYLIQHNDEVDSHRVELNPNSIEPQEIIAYDRNWLFKNYGIPREPCLVVYGGNLGKPQCIPFLVRAIESLSNETKVFFFVIGDGTERHHLEKIQHKVPNFKWIPSVPRTEFQYIVSVADAGLIMLDERFTIPNFPSRLLAYLEAELPVFLSVDETTDIGEIAEKAGFGVSSRSGDLSHFRERINFFISQKENWKEMGRTGKKYLIQNYHVQISFQKIIQKIDI